MPSASPVASAQDLIQTLLDVASQVVLPDWRALVGLFPIFLTILFFAWAAFTVRKFATLGPRRRAPARIQPVTPAGVHMPGGSVSPILAAIGASALFLGLVFGGWVMWVGVTFLVLTLLVWLREGITDYEHNEPRQMLPAVVHEGPPPGVHMPGPSIRPLLAALGATALFGGLVIGGWVLVLAVVFLAWTLLGWLADAKAEYRKVEEADHTGHLENIPPRRLPTRTLQVFGAAFALLILWQLGIFPPASPATADGGGASPTPGGGGAPPGAIQLVAVNIAFDLKEIRVAANEPFTIFLVNQDPPSTPHDVDIRATAEGAPLQDQREIPGGESMAYEYTPLEAGEYVFICSIHPIPAMTGTLIVE